MADSYGGKLTDMVRQARGGTNYGEQFMECPACGAVAECEAVDVGVGLYLRGDYACSQCDWELHGPTDFGFVGPDDVPSAPVDPAAYEEIMNQLPEWAASSVFDPARYRKD